MGGGWVGGREVGGRDSFNRVDKSNIPVPCFPIYRFHIQSFQELIRRIPSIFRHASFFKLSDSQDVERKRKFVLVFSCLNWSLLVAA